MTTLLWFASTWNLAFPSTANAATAAAGTLSAESHSGFHRTRQLLQKSQNMVYAYLVLQINQVTRTVTRTYFLQYQRSTNILYHSFLKHFDNYISIQFSLPSHVFYFMHFKPVLGNLIRLPKSSMCRRDYDFFCITYINKIVSDYPCYEGTTL